MWDLDVDPAGMWVCFLRGTESHTGTAQGLLQLDLEKTQQTVRNSEPLSPDTVCG